jgi:hypothetical protein
MTGDSDLAAHERGDEADAGVRALAKIVARGKDSRIGSARRRGADLARAELLEHALGSIRSVVSDAHRNRTRVAVDVEDLHQEACAAVYEAASNWDPATYPSWTAYAGRAASRQLAALLDRHDELGRSMTRSSARMRRHVRGVRAAAEASGRTLSPAELEREVYEAVGWCGGDGPGDGALIKDGTARSLVEDLPTMTVEAAVVWLDAPAGDDASVSVGELYGVKDPPVGGGALDELGVVIDPSDVTGALDGHAAAAERVRRRMTAPHLQWVALGPLTVA